MQTRIQFGCLVNAFFFYFAFSLFLSLAPSLSHACFHSISSFATTTHLLEHTHIRWPSFWSHTHIFQRRVEHRHCHRYQHTPYDRVRQRLGIGALAASSTFHAWVGEAKRMHAKEMKFSHRWTSEVKPCIDLCAATAIITIISKTKWIFLLLLFVRVRVVCAETKSVVDRACFYFCLF